MKKLIDYIHLYPRIPVAIYDGGEVVGDFLEGIDFVLNTLISERVNWTEDKIKPILRRLNSITKEEVDEFDNLPCNTTPYKKNTEDQTIFEAQRTMWFCSKGFDLFGLIEDELALDAAKLPLKK